MDNMFLKPEKPFLLILSNVNQEVQIFWCESEEDAMDTFDEYQKSFPDEGFFIDTFIEIGSYRDVNVEGFESNIKEDKFNQLIKDCYNIWLKSDYLFGSVINPAFEYGLSEIDDIEDYINSVDSTMLYLRSEATGEDVEFQCVNR